MFLNQYNPCVDDCVLGPHNCKWPFPCWLADKRLKYDKDKDLFRSISKKPFLESSIKPIKRMAQQNNIVENQDSTQQTHAG